MNIQKSIPVKKLFLFFPFCLAIVFLQAQRGWEAGLWAGTATYFGDLNTDFRLNKPGPAAGTGARFNFNERVCLKFGANIGMVRADDADSDNLYERARNLSFRSTVADVGAQLEFNFLPYVHGSKDQNWTPYLFGGFGVTYFNPKANIDDQWVELRPLGTEGQFRGEEYFTVSGNLMYGAGFKVDLSYEWSLNIELGVRKLFSDYLDDVSTVYPDLEDLGEAHGEIAVRLSDRSLELLQTNPDFFKFNNLEFPVGEEGRQRGNSSNNDTYVMFNVGLMYYFGDLRCPYERSKKKK